MNSQMKAGQLLPLIAIGVALSLTYCGVGRKGQPVGKGTQSSLASFPEAELGMTLGRGYDPTHPLELRGDCIANINDDGVTKVSWRDANGIKGEFSETKITTAENLRKELSISASVAGESLWGGGSASFSKFEKFRADGNSFTWLVNYVVEAGEKTIDQTRVTLTPQAKKLVDAGNLDAFYKMCGTEFIRSIRYGGKFTEVMEVDAKESDYVESITAAVSAHTDGGAWGFAGSGTFKSFLDDAKFRSVMTREIQQIGGESLGTDITPDNLGSYLTTFAGQLRNGNAKPVKIETASWDAVGVTGLNGFADMHRKATMESLYTQYRANRLNLDRIADLNYYAAKSMFVISDADLSGLNSKKDLLESQQSSIAAKARKCLDENQCDASGLAIIGVAFPQIIKRGVEDSFGDLAYRMPLSMANYGTDQMYDGKLARLFFLPGSVAGVEGVSSVDIILSRAACASKDALIAEDLAGLASRGIKAGPAAKASANIPGLQIDWTEGHPNREVVLDPDQQGQCTVVRIAARGRVGSIDHLGDISDGISMLLSSGRYSL